MNTMPQKRCNIEKEKYNTLENYPKYYIAKYKDYTFFYIFLKHSFSFNIYKDNEISFCEFYYNKPYSNYRNNETIKLLELSRLLFDEALLISEKAYKMYINIFNRNIFNGYQQLCQFVN